MKKTLKTIAKIFLTIIASVALVTMTGTSENIAMQLAWSFGSFGTLALCAWGLGKLGAFNN